MLYATLKNKNWGKTDASWVVTTHDGVHDRGHDEGHDGGHDEGHDAAHDKIENLIIFCEKPKTRQEIMNHLGLSSRGQFLERYLKPLLESGRLKMTIPDKPQSKNQKYVSSKVQN